MWSARILRFTPTMFKQAQWMLWCTQHHPAVSPALLLVSSSIPQCHSKIVILVLLIRSWLLNTDIWRGLSWNVSRLYVLGRDVAVGWGVLASVYRRAGCWKNRQENSNNATNYKQIGNSFSLRLFCAWHDMWLILAVVELCSSTQLLILLPFSELLKLLQVAWKLMAIQRALDLETTRYVVHLTIWLAWFSSVQH